MVQNKDHWTGNHTSVLLLSVSELDDGEGLGAKQQKEGTGRLICLY